MKLAVISGASRLFTLISPGDEYDSGSPRTGWKIGHRTVRKNWNGEPCLKYYSRHLACRAGFTQLMDTVP